MLANQVIAMLESKHLPVNNIEELVGAAGENQQNDESSTVNTPSASNNTESSAYDNEDSSIQDSSQEDTQDTSEVATSVVTNPVVQEDSDYEDDEDWEDEEGDEYVSSIKIKAKTSVKAGRKLALKTIIYPKTATIKKCKYKSSNKKYATVSKKGVVKTKLAGKGKKVKITVRATDGSGVTATISIRIK